MDQHEYPRPDYAPPTTGPYPKDNGWGIAVIACAIFGVLCGCLAGAGGSLLGLFGAAAASNGGSNSGGAAALSIGGGIVAFIGFAVMACSAVQVAGGVGIMQSKRWGFVLTAVLSVISLLIHVPTLLSSPFSAFPGVIVSAVFLWYCWSRLSGKDGPTPA